MKRNNLTTAVIAGIAGVAGIASVSNAVNLNSDGLGQVLIYPYYTVNNGNDTLISVVNTTDQVKAVKVRFLEGKNSRECLDFNLYLSPYDVWTAALIDVESSIAGHVGEESVKLITSDNSCIAPNYIMSVGQEFLPYAFTGAFDDPVADDMVRCTEGHFEVIEMGTVLGADAASATHVGGVAPGCQSLNDNWLPPSGQWCDDNCDSAGNFAPNGVGDPTINMQAPDGAGGLFGSASLINVANGTDVSYNADAIEAYSVTLQHSFPGNTRPDLQTGGQFDSFIFNNGTVQTDTWLQSAVQAISAVYMHDNLYGEYVLSDTIGANTEWVVTFPTKNFYVDAPRAIGAVPYEPFTAAISSIGACEAYGLGMWDREEQVPNGPSGIVPPSPLPPGVNPDIPLFCWETNVLEFNDQSAPTGNSAIFGSNNTTHLVTRSNAAEPAEFFTTGWVAVSFSQSTDDNASGTTYGGLPVTGFAVQRYVNASLRGDGGTLANYAGIFAHRYSKSITS